MTDTSKQRLTGRAYALQFNGREYIDLGTKPEHELSTSFTIEAWVWVESQTKWAGILSKIFHTGGTQSGYGLLLDGSSGVYMAIKQTDSAVNYQSSGADTITLKSWHHVAFAFDTKEQRLYVDGELKASRASSAGPVDYDPAHAMYIARYQDNNEAHYFKGMLAEVRLWSEARGAEAIKEGMRTRLRGDEAGLVGYWPLDEGSGKTASDRSANTNDGAIHGATWVSTTLPLGPSAPDRDYEAELAERDERIAELEERLKGCDDCRAKLAEKSAEVAALKEQLKAKPSQPDDLTVIEGVGPKTAEVLAKGGVTTYKQLAETPVERLEELLKAGGSRFSMIDPGTWPKQAKLAAAGDRAALKAYQDTLDGGRE